MERNRSNTSFERRRPRGVRRITSACFSINPGRTRPARVSDKPVIASSPKLAATCRKLTPQVSRRPRKNVSSSAADSETEVRFSGPSATYLSSESEVENRTASVPPSELGSIECASTPNPKYGCRIQYFKLCRDAYPDRAKLEISYCCNPAASNRSQASRYKSAVTSSLGTK